MRNVLREQGIETFPTGSIALLDLSDGAGSVRADDPRYEMLILSMVLADGGRPKPTQQ
jgi:hypothetical protein